MNIGQSGAMKKNRIFATKMMEMCKKARLRAINSGIPACVRIAQEAGEAGWCWLDNNSVDGADSQGWDRVTAKNRLSIPTAMLLEGEGIKSNQNGIFSICFFSDGSATGGRLTLSVEGEFSFIFRVDRLTGVVAKDENDEEN